MSAEKDPLMFEMRVEDVQEDVIQASESSQLESNLLFRDDFALCKASCLTDPQTTAVSALRMRQFRLFHEAVCDERFSADHFYDTEDGFPKTLLTMALEQWNRPDPDSQFVLLLIACGSSLDTVDDSTEVAPIHNLIRKANAKLLEEALDAAKQDGEGLTPLHVGVELLQDCEESSLSEVYAILELLLKDPGVEVNEADLRGGLTPLYYAANAANRTAIEMLLDHGADPDIEVDGQNLRQTIEENIGKDFDFMAYAGKVKAIPVKQKLFRCAETNDVNGLKRIAYFASKADTADWNSDNGAMTLMQLACVHGHEQVVAFLLSRPQCDPNRTTASEGRSPVLIAAHHGFYRVLDTLKRSSRVKFDLVEPVTGKTVLHEVFLRDSVKQPGSNRSYAKCVKVLLAPPYKTHPKFDAQISRILNYQDALDGNTALHLATLQSDQEVIKAFLRRGANMGVKNFRDRTAVQSILPDTLEEFLDDDCIEHDGVITDEDFKITFKYDFLAPPILNEQMLLPPKNEEEAEHEDKRALPETEALWYLSRASKSHRALLKHPVISSFLWLKWQRIRTIFYINLFIYMAFVVLLTSAIMIKFGGYSVQRVYQGELAEDQQDSPAREPFNGAYSSALVVLSVLLGGFIALLFLRELFQLLTSVKRYVTTFENLFEVSVLVMSCVIFFDFDDNVDFEVKRHLAALCLLISWTEVLILIGRHPRLSTNITMFTTVVCTFLKFLLWYGLIIVAFGMAFYIMMHRDNGAQQANADYPFFDAFWLALFKTSAMFVGELEFADIPFTENVVSYGVFLAFIFLIVVVLMNLLNGLAVSDTGLIRDEAEVVGWTARVELIAYTESMLLGDPFYFLSNWPPLKLLRRVPSCAVCRWLHRFPRVRDALQKVSGGTKILLFYTCLPKKRALFYPNRKSTRRALLGYKKSMQMDEGVGQRLAISDDVLDVAKALVLAKMRAERADLERQELRSALLDISERMSIMEEMLMQQANKA